MAFKIFLDANIILDRTLKRSGLASAAQVFDQRLLGRFDLFTAPAVLHIVSYFTAQFYTREQTRKAILLLLNEVQVIDCNHDTAVIALHAHFEDIEDALLYYTALHHKIDYFISSDKKLKRTALPQLPVYTAAEIVAAVL